MLEHLHIRNFAIIDTIELDLRPGFTTISGETGAGKSIMVDALAFLLGARAERNWVRKGSRGAEIVGDFDITNNPPALAWLQENQLEEDQRCLLRRSLLAAGGSRAWINGRPVTLGQLQSLASHLISIHGQHEHQHLMEPVQQRQLLDHWGNSEAQTAVVADLYNDWKKCKTKLQQIIDTPAADPQYLQLIRYQIDELKREALNTEQYQQLSSEHERLAHADDLQQGLANALSDLNNENSGANTRLQASVTNLQPLLELDLDLATEIREVHAMLTEAAINIEESQAGLRNILGQCDSDPQRLVQLDQQLSQQHSLARKHQVEPDQLQQQLVVLKQRVSELSQNDQLRQQFETKLETGLKKFRQQATKLSSQRRKTAEFISNKATELLETLGFNGALINIEVATDKQAEPRSHGQDTIRILVRTNPGQAQGLLQKIASGGELSRISLAIQLATRQMDTKQSSMAGITQVYDEVDAGIGGDTANRVGQMLSELARDGQVLCVTHLAQVAARANTHYLVHKSSDDETTNVSVVELKQAQRVEEIARMLSGKLSASSRKHAQELLVG
ncbi:MAG: DNA repair protein RecN [Xanthomonadales bacterium]|nr:DNA repair protein RecN [Xanthomonadales bacterium]